MPIIDSPFTDPDMIEALYKDPDNEEIHVAYALETGAIQLGLISPTMGASSSGGAAAGGIGGGEVALGHPGHEPLPDPRFPDS